jgi:hypothetical protein
MDNEGQNDGFSQAPPWHWGLGGEMKGNEYRKIQ